MYVSYYKNIKLQDYILSDTMKRKIIRHGPSTLIISLPATWVKQHNIKNGDEIDVIEDGNKLIIGSDGSAANYTMRGDVSGFKPYLIAQFLSRTYQKGYDTVHITHNNPDILLIIQEKTSDLIGFEIIEQTDKYCVIQSLAHNIDLDFDNSLRKGFLNVKIMLDTCVKAYNNNDKATLQSLNPSYNQVKRYSFFCMRQINKMQYALPEIARQSHHLYDLIGVLEELASSTRLLSEHLAQANKKNNSILDLLEMVVAQYSVAYSYFYKAEVDKANGAYHVYTEIDNKINILVNTKLSGFEILTLYKIKDASHLIHHFTTSRLDFLKEKEIEKKQTSS